MTTPALLPEGLRDRVLAAALGARAGGRALPDLPGLSPVAAFSRAAGALLGVLSTLPGTAWRSPVLRDLDVQALVGHLTGVEDDVQRALAGDAAVACADHVASTQPAALQQAGRSTEETRRQWRDAVDRTLADVEGADLEAVVGVHGMRLPLGSLLVVRAFELWTHENDIRRTAGLAPSVPDPGTLRLMTDLAVRLLPHGMARVTAPVPPIDVRMVLTGDGGGTWSVALGERTAAQAVPEVGVVADAVGFCRLVANRIGPDELGAHLTGAVAYADAVLTGAAALALD